MADLKNIRAVYFLGIGGIGMSALARYFRSLGKRVSGYDKTETELTRQLISEGIAVDYADDPDRLPKDVQLVVFTPAIPTDHRGFQYYRDHGYELLKRSDVLGLVTAGSLNVCVAGTHGKTTISTLIAHILRDSGFGCNAFLGGISANYNTNFWSNERNLCVVEADEYDRSFLKLNPDLAVISSMDADHLDIYGTAAAVEAAFVDFSRRIKKGGSLVSKYGLPLPARGEGIAQIRYALRDNNADVYAENISMTGGAYLFDVRGKDWSIPKVKLNIGGWHNIENTLAAIVVSKKLGLTDEQILRAVDGFRGVRRRFEYHVMGNGPVYIDDYAHHPQELRALIGSAKELFPGKKALVIFQPHLFSRTRDFADGFAASLDMADEVILLPLYPARELPMEGVSSASILDKMKISQKRILDKPEVLKYVQQIREKDKLLLISAGAGDIDTLVKPLTEIVNVK